MIGLIRDKIILSASVSCFDLYNISSQLPQIEQANIGLLHFDVVDGSFNDCIILGTPTLADIRPHTSLPIEAHLAIYKPEKHIDQFVEAGADYIAVHYEVMKKPLKVFNQIRKAGAKPILALRVETDYTEDMDELFEEVEWITKLTVNPGYSGQPFNEGALKIIANLRRAIERQGLNVGIQADGNINSQTIPSVVSAGADMLTGGTSGLFKKNKTIKESAQEMIELAKNIL